MAIGEMTDDQREVWLNSRERELDEREDLLEEIRGKLGQIAVLFFSSKETKRVPEKVPA